MVKSKIESCTEWLTNKEKLPLPQINISILENDLAESLCEYLRSELLDCMNNPKDLPYSKLIESITATELKKKIDLAEATYDDKYYNILEIEDYENILEFMRCTLHNEEIEEKEAELLEYQELQTLYGIVDGKYFTKGNGSQLGIQIGDYAVIDDTYFNMAVNLLEKFVENFPN